jgi:repressor LexA
MQLTRGQQRVIQQISRLKQQLGRMPSVPELSAALGYSYQALRQHLGELERKGLLEVVSRGQGRTSEIVPTLQGKSLLGLGIPLLGQIAAGRLEDAAQDLRGLLALPSKPGFYALVVEGDSMADYLVENDIVIVRATSEFRQGQITAVYYQGRTTLKYVYRKGARAELRAHNPSYPPIVLPARELQVQGVYDSLIRGGLISELLEVVM